MPAGIINALDNITKSHKKPKPYIILIILVISIFVLIYSQRLLGIHSGYYNLFIIMTILIIISLIIASTVVHNFKFTHNEYLEYLSHMFNSTASRNFLIVFSFLLFVMFIYESAEYEDDHRHALTDKLFFGHNTILSNRLYGLLLIIIFGVYTGYTIYMTTDD
mgnify:CR=1 FL=1